MIYLCIGFTILWHPQIRPLCAWTMPACVNLATFNRLEKVQHQQKSAFYQFYLLNEQSSTWPPSTWHQHYDFWMIIVFGKTIPNDFIISVGWWSMCLKACRLTIASNLDASITTVTIIVNVTIVISLSLFIVVVIIRAYRPLMASNCDAAITSQLWHPGHPTVGPLTLKYSGDF